MSEIGTTPIWRSVMTEEEYARERDRIRTTYGSDGAQAKARAEQELARLFEQSRWTQQKLADAEGKSPQWVAVRLCLGRFLNVSNISTVCGNLTEGRFRKFWTMTSALKSNEDARFREVERLLVLDADKPKEKKTRAKPPRKQGPMPKTDAVREAIRPFVQKGIKISRDEWSEKLGVSHSTIEAAEHRELGRLEGLAEAKAVAQANAAIEPLAPSEMKPTMQARYDAAIRKARIEIRHELMTEVKVEVYRDFEEIYLKHWREKCTHADRVLASHKGVITRRQFRTILAGLHPDQNQFAGAREAFELLKGLESVLVKPEGPITSAPPLPASVAEMMAQRRTRQARK